MIKKEVSEPEYKFTEEKLKNGKTKYTVETIEKITETIETDTDKIVGALMHARGTKLHNRTALFEFSKQLTLAEFKLFFWILLYVDSKGRLADYQESTMRFKEPFKTHEQLAKKYGVSRTRLSQIMSKFKNIGFVRKSPEGYYVLNPLYAIESYGTVTKEQAQLFPEIVDALPLSRGKKRALDTMMLRDLKDTMLKMESEEEEINVTK